jgi:hypothetical protein
MPIHGIYTKSDMRFANKSDRRKHRADLRAIEAIKAPALCGHALATDPMAGVSGRVNGSSHAGRDVVSTIRKHP